MYSPKNRKFHKFATTNRNFKKSTLSDMRHRKTYMYTCMSIFSKIGLIDLSKPCAQIYLPKNSKFTCN